MMLLNWSYSLGREAEPAVGCAAGLAERAVPPPKSGRIAHFSAKEKPTSARERTHLAIALGLSSIYPFLRALR